MKNFAGNSVEDDIQREAACDEADDIVEDDSGCDEDGDDFNSVILKMLNMDNTAHHSGVVLCPQRAYAPPLIESDIFT